jgi:hypothetical protein
VVPLKAFTAASLVAVLVVMGAHGSTRSEVRWTTAGPFAVWSPASGCVAAWRVVPTPAVGYGQLNGVAASTPTDTWAVGRSGVVGRRGRPYHSLIEHWDGSRWKVVPSPRLSWGELNDVVAVSPTDAWAVGDVNSYPKPSEPVIEHWDGRTWNRVTVGGVREGLYGVTAVSARDAWAVGGKTTLHWDGNLWTRVPRARGAYLGAVVAVSARDVWAVGGWRDPTRPVATHWDGRSWHPFVLPRPPGDPAEYWSLVSVAAVSAGDVWAAGGGEVGSTVREPLVYHWNGRRWRRATSPSVDGKLFGIAARSAKDVWTIAWADPRGGGSGATFAGWNGKTWRADKPVPRRLLSAVATDTAVHLWAVGSTGIARPTPLIERYGC